MTYKIGDRVQIINPGETYNLHIDKAKQLGARMDRWARGKVPIKNEYGEILNIESDWYILIRTDKGEEYVVKSEALEKIEDEPISSFTSGAPLTIDIETVREAIKSLESKYSVMNRNPNWLSSQECIYHHWVPGFPHEGDCIQQQPNESMTQKAKKTMSSIIKKIKDIKLSQEDRLLRKHDFENDNGEMMSEARDLMLDEILAERWTARRLEIAADLKLVEQLEK